MSVVLALKRAITEVRTDYGYQNDYWNFVCDTLAIAYGNALIDQRDEAAEDVA